MSELKKFVLKEIQDSRKIEREFIVTGKVKSAEEYSAKTKNGVVKGVVFEIDTLPYKLRLLNGSIKGGTRPGHFIGCTMDFTGITREYDGREYFSPLDGSVVTESGLSKLAKAGVAYAGSLD